jgi:serine protease AprX
MAALAGSLAFGSAQAATSSTADYSMAAVTSGMGASSWWNAGYTGAGVDVALIDSGVSPVPGLSAGGKLVYGPDLSLESQAPNLHNYDTYGHGTFMAGLIAGNDGTASGYRGVAPGARIVSLKVATADGGTDVSQVIAAIDWVVQHRHDGGLNIRVINLSYGTNSLQSSGMDPLSFAVETAWKAGIVVVASAGNTGYQRGNGAPGLADPAYNPYVIGVGAYDTLGTADWHDDVVASYSASSTGAGGSKNPDFVAPGSHLQGLRDPNSLIDALHPDARIGTRFFRGSGTSEAAAVTSGAIALILQKYPTLTPDAVKRFITSNAQKVASFDSQAQGAGELNLAKMLTNRPSSYAQSFSAATGNGTLEAARGSDHISRNGVVLTGEHDIFGAPVSTTSLATAEAAGNTWSGGTWNGNTWSGNTWSGNTWSGNTWSGNAWDGNTWSGNTWSGNTWSGNTWSGNTWSGSSWSGNTWSGNTWAGGSWS